MIIGCGGTFTAQDAFTKITNGASLVQLITGMIYRGPQVIAEINSGLLKLLVLNNLPNIQAAIGLHVR